MNDKKYRGTIESIKPCAHCGKETIINCPSEWVYKRHHMKNNVMYFCSWSCLRNHDEEWKKTHKRHRKKKAEL